LVQVLIKVDLREGFRAVRVCLSTMGGVLLLLITLRPESLTTSIRRLMSADDHVLKLLLGLLVRWQVGPAVRHSVGNVDKLLASEMLAIGSLVVSGGGVRLISIRESLHVDVGSHPCVLGGAFGVRSQVHIV